MKVGFIYNKNAGERKGRELEKIVDCFETHGIHQIYHALDKFKLSEKDILGIYGGDGTLHHTLTKCFEYYDGKIPQILFVKGGTINSVADDMKLGDNIERAVFRIRQDKYKSVLKPVMKFETSNNSEYGFIYGSGMIYEFINEYLKGDVRGAPKVFSLVGRMLTDNLFRKQMMKEIDASIHAENGSKYVAFNEHNVMIISTVKNMGFGVKMMPQAGDHGKTQLRGGMISEADIINNIVNAYTNPIHGVHSRLADHIRITPKKSFNYVLDGELKMLDDELNIFLKQIKFIIPNP